MTNQDMRQNWTEGAAGWVANQHIFDAVFAPATAAILEAARIEPGNRLLDVGCGTGTLLAVGAAAGASVMGVDISPGMAEAARRRVPEAGVLVGDAQTADLLAEAPGDRFDRVVSRFGVMFFADPVAAFANIRAAVAVDGRLTFVCWRGRDENPMFTLGTSVLAERLDLEPSTFSDNAPGPTAFADRDRLAGLLSEAGWTGVAVDALDFECDYRIDTSIGIEERMAAILATATGRSAKATLAPSLGADGWEALLDDVRAELRRHLVDGAVRFPAATWLVTAASAAG